MPSPGLLRVLTCVGPDHIVSAVSVVQHEHLLVLPFLVLPPGPALLMPMLLPALPPPPLVQCLVPLLAPTRLALLLRTPHHLINHEALRGLSCRGGVHQSPLRHVLSVEQASAAGPLGLAYVGVLVVAALIQQFVPLWTTQPIPADVLHIDLAVLQPVVLQSK